MTLVEVIEGLGHLGGLVSTNTHRLYYTSSTRRPHPPAGRKLRIRDLTAETVKTVPGASTTQKPAQSHNWPEPRLTYQATLPLIAEMRGDYGIV